MLFNIIWILALSLFTLNSDFRSNLWDFLAHMLVYGFFGIIAMLLYALFAVGSVLLSFIFAGVISKAFGL